MTTKSSRHQIRQSTNYASLIKSAPRGDQVWALGTGQSQRLIVVEYLTWGAVAAEIGKGVLQELGAKVFGDVFGSDEMKIDLRQLVLEFASVVQRVVRAELERARTQSLEASLTSLQNLYAMYINNGDTAFLKDLVFKADELAEQMHALGMPTVAGFAIVGGVELSILQERYRKRMEDKRNIRATAARLVTKADSFEPDLRARNEALFSPLQFGLRPHYTFRDVEIWIPLDRYRDAAALRAQHIEQEFLHARKQLIDPLLLAQSIWRQIAEKYN